MGGLFAEAPRTALPLCEAEGIPLFRFLNLSGFCAFSSLLGLRFDDQK